MLYAGFFTSNRALTADDAIFAWLLKRCRFPAPGNRFKLKNFYLFVLQLPKGSTMVFDHGFNDYDWYDELTPKGIFFVTRSKSNAVVTPLKKRQGRKAAGVTKDRTILPGPALEKCRQVIYEAPDDGRILIIS